MKLFDEILDMMIGLNEDQLRKIKNFILYKLNLKDVDDKPIITVTHCPACGSVHIIKFGKKNGKQRYTCKDCHKVFMPTTKTIAYKSKHTVETWSNYVSSMLA